MTDENAARAAHDQFVKERKADGKRAAAKTVIEQQYEQRSYEDGDLDELSAAQREEMKRL